ncbi:MAG: NUDIX hydrolase [Actinomycetota bacterium]|nr:NUDIX hydrolase [Actinomycetota bacterium]
MKAARQVSAGGVTIRGSGPDAEVLLAARRVRSGELVWGLPKGLVEQGESPAEAAVREVREETGFDAEVRGELGEIDYWFVWEGRRIHKVVHFFLMRSTGGDVSRRDHEMEEVRWFPLREAADAAGFDSERKVIRRAADALGAE